MIQKAFNNTIARKQKTNDHTLNTVARFMADQFESSFNVSAKELIANCPYI